MPPTRDAFCSFCGTSFGDTTGYPRTCANCNVTIWANPVPVSIALIPVRLVDRTGLLVVRRGIDPARGKLGIVGGFLEEHETWQHGAAREAREETNVVVDPAALTPVWFTSTAPRPNRVLLFSESPELDAATLPPFTPNHESTERGLVFGPDGLDEVFAFPLHVEAARRFFAARGASGPHRFTQVLGTNGPSR